MRLSAYEGSIWRFMNSYKHEPPSTFRPEPNHPPDSERQNLENGPVLIQGSGKGSFNVSFSFFLLCVSLFSLIPGSLHAELLPHASATAPAHRLVRVPVAAQSESDVCCMAGDWD